MSADEAKKKALSLLDRRDYSAGELIKKLRDKGIDPVDAESAVGRLCELGLVNDANYASMIVRHYSAKGFGRQRVREELRRRLVPASEWDEALDSMPEQTGALDCLLRSRLRSPEPDRDELRRASDYLLRRGFGWEEIREAVERFKRERNSDI